jgi:hypothetical protein
MSLLAIDREDPRIKNREEKWSNEVTSQLPTLLTRLLRSKFYGLGEGRGLPPPATRYGVYLLSERGRARYVGRVGLTERSRRSGKGFSNFRTRLQGHVRPRHSEGTYAYSRTVKHFRRKGLPLAETRKANCEDATFQEEFRRQCNLVRRMDFQIVEITDNRLAAVFEIYAAAALGLRDQTFAVS